jgi:hypothetical protein
VGWQKDGWQKMDHSPANDPSVLFSQTLTEISRQDRQENGGRRMASIGMALASTSGVLIAETRFLGWMDDA